MVPAILTITVIVLVGIVIWLLYTTLFIKGRVGKSTKVNSNSRTQIMSAELFVETYRGKKHKNKDGYS